MNNVGYIMNNYCYIINNFDDILNNAVNIIDYFMIKKKQDKVLEIAE